MPLHTCLPQDDHLAVRRVLQEGFVRLVNLEEFVSTQHNLTLDLAGGEYAVVWMKWSKLKRLALWHPDADLEPEFWNRIAKHSSLETLVLPNFGRHDRINIKEQYFNHTDRPFTVIFCKPPGWYTVKPEDSLGDWEDHNPTPKMTILEHDMPEVGDQNRLELYQGYFRASAENGTLWNWEGQILKGPGDMGILYQHKR
ncbi:hypothetical protein BKA66DRAFT_607568 [Pyrenochaeta sp. MPI-SDFR-AT-0127]|nr:hypothetical protein BKA66DRAFT_607568 [Pyrenochaeta sp. MPI-SDFR-AT-0127]